MHMRLPLLHENIMCPRWKTVGTGIVRKYPGKKYDKKTALQFETVFYFANGLLPAAFFLRPKMCLKILIVQKANRGRFEECKNIAEQKGLEEILDDEDKTRGDTIESIRRRRKVLS